MTQLNTNWALFSSFEFICLGQVADNIFLKAYIGGSATLSDYFRDAALLITICHHIFDLKITEYHSYNPRQYFNSHLMCTMVQHHLRNRKNVRSTYQTTELLYDKRMYS